MAKRTLRPAKPAVNPVVKQTGWNPPAAPGAKRDRYTQEYIAGKLARITEMMGQGGAKSVVPRVPRPRGR